jgi:hypothetical protein
MDRERILNELTLLETVEYRKRGLVLNGKYAHEPKEFRLTFYNIFDKLSDSDLETLYNLKTK